ncbi:phosphatidylethanolamine-binding protein 4 isoform X2 [Ornithorhynchus anatinus]|nr:phosphatidylethanolamine-binding protein 4 isoform X2 [Ornithorhynchus anatinus]
MKFSAAGPAGATLFLGLAALISSQGGEELDLELDMGTCVMDPVVGEDAAFCRGGLEVIYPELGDVGCLYIPRCNNYRERISKEWNEPSVRFPQAHPKKKYVLMMVDPDAYSRADPKFRYWRHWLVTEIQGSDLQAGKPKGHVLAKYYPPGPPRRSGYHRYQFLVYEQPAHETILLSSNKSAFRAIPPWSGAQVPTPIAITAVAAHHHFGLAKVTAVLAASWGLPATTAPHPLNHCSPALPSGTHGSDQGSWMKSPHEAWKDHIS